MAMFSNETLDPELYSDVVAEKEEFEKNEDLVKYYKYQEDLGRPFECDQVGPQIVFHENPQPENKDKFYNPIRIDFSTQTPGYLADVAKEEIQKILELFCISSSNKIDVNPQTLRITYILKIQTPGKYLVRRTMIHKEGGFSRLVNTDDEERMNQFKNQFESQPCVERVPDGLKVSTEGLPKNHISTIMELLRLWKKQCLLLPMPYRLEPGYFTEGELNNLSAMESFMLSSSFINLFALPLDEFPEEECFGKPNFVISSQIQDPWKVTRPAVDLSWDPKNEELIAAAYADHRASSWQQYNDRFAYIWNTRNTSTPAFILDGEAPLTVVEFNNMDSNEIAGCTMCGQIGLWDIRVGSTSVWLSGRKTFHDRPTCLQWCSRFTGYELTAAALDGQILWYDMRNRTVPIDKVILDMSRNPNPKWQNAIGVTSYCFEPNLPTKFLVGTTTGMVIEGNKKGKTISEKIGNRIFQCSNGPILNVFRNPKFTKYFFTVGDWLLKIWCDDYTNEPIYWTDFDSAMLTCAVWSKVKSSVVLVGRDDGQVELWDYLENETTPRFSLTVSDYPIRKVAINDFGEYSAACGDDGIITLLRWTRHFGVFTEDDKHQTVSWLDREINREKSLEIKLREIRIKERAEKRSKLKIEEESDFEVFYLEKATKHYKKILDDVFQKRVDKYILGKGDEYN